MQQELVSPPGIAHGYHNWQAILNYPYVGHEALVKNVQDLLLLICPTVGQTLYG